MDATAYSVDAPGAGFPGRTLSFFGATRIAVIELRSTKTRVRSIAIAATGAIAVFGSVAIQGAQRNLQEGLRAGGAEDIMLSRYQEVRIRHLQQTLMRYISRPPRSP